MPPKLIREKSTCTHPMHAPHAQLDRHAEQRIRFAAQRPRYAASKSDFLVQCTVVAPSAGADRWCSRWCGGAVCTRRHRVSCAAPVLPMFRRRGIQSALLAARLAPAQALQCGTVSCSAKRGSQSHRNVQRAGFELLHVRPIWHNDHRFGLGHTRAHLPVVSCTDIALRYLGSGQGLCPDK